MRRPLFLVALLTVSTGCSLYFEVADADRPSTAADVDAYFNGFYEAALHARMVCSGTTLDHARTRWLGPKASLIDRAQALFATGRVRLKRDLGRDCLAAIAAAELACHAIDATLLDPSGVCGRAFAGILADGADCASDSECSLGSFCDPGGGACPGHCTPYGRLLESCSAVDGRCGYGLDCNCGYGTPPCGTPSCNPTEKSIGQGCGPGGAPCGPGLYCAGETFTCTPLLGEGDDCTANAGACAPALRCYQGETPARCIARTPAFLGCVPGGAECIPSAWCDDVTTPATPSCRTFGGPGAACGDKASTEYAGCIDADCQGGSCQAIPAYGEACTSGQRCSPSSTPATCTVTTGLCGEVCG